VWRPVCGPSWWTSPGASRPRMRCARARQPSKGMHQCTFRHRHDRRRRPGDLWNRRPSGSSVTRPLRCWANGFTIWWPRGSPTALRGGFSRLSEDRTRGGRWQDDGTDRTAKRRKRVPGRSVAGCRPKGTRMACGRARPRHHGSQTGGGGVAESQEGFRSVVENAPEAIFVSGQGYFRYLNPRPSGCLGPPRIPSSSTSRS